MMPESAADIRWSNEPVILENRKGKGCDVLVDGKFDMACK
jgi:hypothetical protein